MQPGTAHIVPEVSRKFLPLLVPVAVALIALLLSVRVTSEAAYTVVNVLKPFDTDEADHANAALEIWHRATHGGVLAAIRSQAFYPPLHAIVVAASYAVTSPSIVSSRIPSVIALIVYALGGVLLTWGAARRCSLSFQASATLAALFLFFVMSSPITVEHSVLCMLETTGMVGAVFMFLGAVLLDRDSRFGLPAMTIGALAVMFTKYSMGIILWAALFFCWLSFARSDRVLVRRKLFSTGVICGVAFLLWFSVTDRDELINFFITHPSYAPLLSWENLTFELSAWVRSYTVHPVVGVVLLLAAVEGARRSWKTVFGRFMVTSIISCFGILALSTTNEERHSIVMFPAIVVLGLLGLESAWRWAARRAPRTAAIGAGVTVVALAVMLRLFLAGLPQSLAGVIEGDPKYTEIQQRIAEYGADARPILVLGATDSFSIEALRWEVSRLNGAAYTDVHVDGYPFTAKQATRLRLRGRLPYRPSVIPSFPRGPLGTVVSEGGYETVVVVYRDGKERPPISNEDRRALEGWQKGEERAPGIRVEIYRRTQDALARAAGNEI